MCLTLCEAEEGAPPSTTHGEAGAGFQVLLKNSSSEGHPGSGGGGGIGSCEQARTSASDKALDGSSSAEQRMGGNPSHGLVSRSHLCTRVCTWRGLPKLPLTGHCPLPMGVPVPGPSFAGDGGPPWEPAAALVDKKGETGNERQVLEGEHRAQESTDWPHFRGGETEAQRVSVTHSRTWNLKCPKQLF